MQISILLTHIVYTCHTGFGCRFNDLRKFLYFYLELNILFQLLWPILSSSMTINYHKLVEIMKRIVYKTLWVGRWSCISVKILQTGLLFNAQLVFQM